MPRPPSSHPTQLELEILNILWDRGASPVREVRDALAQAGQRDLAYTSVMTVLGIMHDKGYVKRAKQGVGYIYRAKVRRQTTVGRMLLDVVNRAFEGSSAAAAMRLLQDADLDEEQIQQLRQILERK